MKRRVCCLCFMFVVLIFSMLTERSLLAKAQFPGDVLSALEIKKLVTGQTAEVAINKTKGKGLFYFSSSGEFKQLINNWLEEGHWKVNKRDRLCMSISGGSWNCRLLIRNKEDIGQYVVKQNGNHRRELTYKSFNDGNKLLEFTKSSSPPWKN